MENTVSKTGKRNQQVRQLTFAAVCLALCMVLPFLTGQIPQIGQALSPMHIPVFLCGFLCTWPYAALVGFIAPLLRNLLFSMPAMPGAIAMAFELAAYGFLTGILYRVFPKKTPFLYATLLCAMVGGRLVWGAARFVLAGLSGSEFPFSAFLAGAVTNAVPGIILHIALVPAVVIALNRAGFLSYDE